MGRLGRAFGRLGYASASPRVDPISILGTDLIAWWDADPSTWDGNGGITLATGVSSWRDIVAGYPATQATGSAQPAYSATSFGGAPALAYDGTDDFLGSTDAGLLAALPAGAVGCELWFLGSNDTLAGTAGAKPFGGYGTTTGGTSRNVSRNSASGVNRAIGITDASVTNTAVNLSSRHVIRFQVEAAAIRLSVDDSAAAVNNTAVTNTSVMRFRLGTASNGVGFLQGQIAVHLITKPLSTDKAAGLLAYLMARRNL